MRMYTKNEVASILMFSREKVKKLIEKKVLVPDKTEVSNGGRIRHYFSEKTVREYAEKVGIFYDFELADSSPKKKKEFGMCGLWIITIDRGYLDRNNYLKHKSLAVTNSIKYTYMFDNEEEPRKIVEAYGIGRVEPLYMEV